LAFEFNSKVLNLIITIHTNFYSTHFRVVSFFYGLYLCYSDSTLNRVVSLFTGCTCFIHIQPFQGCFVYLRVVLVLFIFNPFRVVSFIYGLYLFYSYSTLIRVVSLFTGCTCVIHIQPLSGLSRYLRVVLVLFIFNPFQGCFVFL
jgi:hypothetical protein